MGRHSNDQPRRFNAITRRITQRSDSPVAPRDQQAAQTATPADQQPVQYEPAPLPVEQQSATPVPAPPQPVAPVPVQQQHAVPAQPQPVAPSQPQLVAPSQPQLVAPSQPQIEQAGVPSPAAMPGQVPAQFHFVQQDPQPVTAQAVQPQPPQPQPVLPQPAQPQAVQPQPVQPQPVQPAADSGGTPLYESVVTGSIPVQSVPSIPVTVVPVPVTAEQVSREPVAAEQVSPEPVAPGPVSPELVAAEQASPEPVVPEPAAPQPVAYEPALPVVAQAPSQGLPQGIQAQTAPSNDGFGADDELDGIDEQATAPSSSVRTPRGAIAPVLPRSKGVARQSRSGPPAVRPPGGQGADATRPRRGRRAAFIAAGVVVVLLVTGCVAWTKNVFNPVLPAAAWAQTCEPTKINVIADPSIADALRKSAQGFDATTACVETTVRAAASADTASTLAVGGDPKADVWIPDSPAWEPRMQVLSWSLIRQAPVADFGESIASSPLVFATPSKNADALNGANLQWNTIADGDVPALLPEPAQNGSSLAALAEIKATASASDDLAFSRDMIELGKTIPSGVQDAFNAAERAAAPTVVITTEQSVVSQNETTPDHQFFALYPKDGTVSVSYPFVRVAGPSTGNHTKDTLIAALERQFSTDTRNLAQAGFRTASGGGGFAAKGVVANPPRTRPALDGGAQVGLLQNWSAITVRSRVLVAVDTSGSMSEDAGGTSRISVFQDAANGMLNLLPPQTDMGVWTFSTNQVGTQPWAQRAPIAALDDPNHAAQVKGVFASLGAMVDGDTGLYDTVLAAVKAVRSSYDTHTINYVLVVTDGHNDNPGGGIDLNGLLSQLKSMDDKSKPVPVIMVGMGPDTDVSAMSQIAYATNGAVYTAEHPQDLSNVLVDALAQRTCRPYCQ